MPKKYIPDSFDHYWHMDKKLSTFVDDLTEEEFILKEKLELLAEKSMKKYGRPDYPQKRARLKSVSKIVIAMLKKHRKKKG